MDPNPANAVGAGTLITAAGQIVVLARIEADAASKMVRVTIRSSSSEVSANLGRFIMAALE